MNRIIPTFKIDCRLYLCSGTKSSPIFLPKLAVPYALRFSSMIACDNLSRIISGAWTGNVPISVSNLHASVPSQNRLSYMSQFSSSNSLIV